jgi:hypothetical protein
MLSVVSRARETFDPYLQPPLGSLSEDTRQSSMSLAATKEVAGKEPVLRKEEKKNGKRHASASPPRYPQKRQQREPKKSTIGMSDGEIRVDQNGWAQGRPGRTIKVSGVNAIANLTGGDIDNGNTQSLENPQGTTYLTNSALIFNQNINNGAGQQNITVSGAFNPPPPPPTSAAVPTEYIVPEEPERRTNQDSGQQQFEVSENVTNNNTNNTMLIGNASGHALSRCVNSAYAGRIEGLN